MNAFIGRIANNNPFCKRLGLKYRDSCDMDSPGRFEMWFNLHSSNSTKGKYLIAMQETYYQLKNRMGDIWDLTKAQAVLNWDRQTSNGNSCP